MISGVLMGCAPASPGTDQPAAGEDVKEVAIGVYEPMTGAQAAGGVQTMQGVDLAYEQKSEALGVPIRMVLVDNRGDKAESATAMTRLIEQEKAIVLLEAMDRRTQWLGVRFRKQQESP